ncbi:MAG TPA: hypothetical protein VGO11_14415 [Chthoniobacteraceae bacterium]|nr:hypothetical protein [Chthoniobacteraceae bacterium]
MKLPPLPHFHIHRFDRLAIQTGLELAAGAVLFLLLTRWASL